MHKLPSNLKFSIIFPVITASIFFAFNFYLITHGHFHEDVYILFIYVDNFIDGHGITFFPGGPHTEGATDFLWMMLLIGLGYLGFNAGTSAIIFNSFGVFIVSSILSLHIQTLSQKHRLTFFLLFPATFLWISQEAITASLGGFSVFMYLALITLAFSSLTRIKYLIYTPYISILMALFRPDGVIIGIVFTLVGLRKVYKIDRLKQYIIGMLIAFVVGCAYFIWRYNYFGNLLPLPLYVKGSTPGFSGLSSNIKWLIHNAYLVLSFLLLCWKLKCFKQYIILCSPAIALFTALSIAEQAQNNGFRFQAPIYMILYCSVIKMIVTFVSKYEFSKISKSIFAFFLIVFIYVGINNTSKAIQEITYFNYINQFPYTLGKKLPSNLTIALTEAGRMAYWNQSTHRLIDLGGLNSEFPAKNTILVNYVESLSPDVLMYHHNGRMKKDAFKDHSTHYIYISEKTIYLLDLNINPTYEEQEKLSKITNAAIVSTRYIQNHFTAYDVFLVDYTCNRSYSHVYAFKRILNMKEHVQALLDESFKEENKLSYQEMIRLRNDSLAR
ncbi:MAG: hypothetical protein GY847_33575 [Proteobacteria bacterium]|nr:hypothetical protein [Pseudomonadota bacterium]